MSCHWGLGLAAIQPELRAKNYAVKSLSHCLLVCAEVPAYEEKRKKKRSSPLDITQMRLFVRFLFLLFVSKHCAARCHFSKV